jgi:hypothetical protein
LLSDVDGVRQIIKLTSPQAELLFHFRSERYHNEQTASLGLFAAMSNIHGGTSRPLLRLSQPEQMSSRMVLVYTFSANLL